MKEFMDIRSCGNGLFPKHASLIPYKNLNEVEKGESELKMLLNGTWKFSFSDHVLKVPEGFYEENYPDSNWDNIIVPKCWQHQGYGQKNYLNCRYPFPVDPPYIPMESNVGCYRREFYFADNLEEKNVHLVFDGVCSAFCVWVNGEKIGFSQGSHTPSEFDITKYIKTGRNVLAVQVYQQSFASYLECQDMWRFNGIFRDVYLLAKEKCELYNVEAWAQLEDDYKNGCLDVSVSMMKPDSRYSVRMSLKYKGECIAMDEKEAEEKLSFSFVIKNPDRWTAETPNLYQLEAELLKNGQTIEVYRVNIGFREIEIKDGIFMINGRAVKLKGVNHHDTTPDGGYTMTKEEMEKDIVLMKQFNINAVRTSHYPPDSYLLDLCDKYGIYVIDEADVEAHGGSTVCDWNNLAEDENWKELHIDRADSMIKRDINHPSIIMWSLGNESGEGKNHTEMANYIKLYDFSRPVHYECAKREENKKCLDVYSEMYPTLEVCENYAQNTDAKKPMFLCEYAHAMGNGPGALKEYVDLFHKYDLMMGGCIWEWADHGVKEIGENGEMVYRYGGDYGDWPNDANFCCDGLCFPDRTPHVGMIHMKNIYGPVEITGFNRKTAGLINRYDFNDLSDTYIDWELVKNGDIVQSGKIDGIQIEPHKMENVEIPYDDSLVESDGEYFVNLYFKAKSASFYAPAGHELCRRQIEIKTEVYKKPERHEKFGAIRVMDSTDRISIMGDDFSVEFSKICGTITDYVYKGSLLIKQGPLFNAYWATTDNDWTFGSEESFFKIWENASLSRAKNYIRNVVLLKADESVAEIAVSAIYSAPSFMPLFRTEYRYKIFASGAMEISIEALPKEYKKGHMLPCVPKIGTKSILSADMKEVEWFGLGPWENYQDKKDASIVGKYRMSIDDLSEMHIMPQENGNRGEIRWVSVENDAGCGLHICGDRLMNFSARHYTDEELDTKKHRDELVRVPECIFHFDYKVSGVGTGSCGPKTLEKYQVKPEITHFGIFIEPYKA